MLPGKWHSCCAKEIEEALSLSLKVSVATGQVVRVIVVMTSSSSSGSSSGSSSSSSSSSSRCCIAMTIAVIAAVPV